MSDTRTQLLVRKRDIFAAIRRLEQDHDEGMLDGNAYRAARERYELEAAGILQRLDSLPPAADEAAPARDRQGRWPLVAGTGLLALAAIVALLVGALHARGAGQTATGNVPTVASLAPHPSSQVLAAQRAVRARPRDVNALIDLGDAYWQNGQIVPADTAFLAAAKLAPQRPEGETMHAMVLGSTGHDAQGLAVLRQVERSHPTYSRAWLLDGLIAARTRAGYARAIASWQHFLKVEPRGPVSAQVRQLIAATRHSMGRP